MGFWSALLFGDPAASSGPLRQPRQRLAPGSAAGETKARVSSVGISYRLERARRKSIGLIITTDGLLIRAPNWTPLYEIDAAIAERREWIGKALARQQKRRDQLAEHRDGGHMLFRGKRLKVELRAGLFDSVDLTETRCVLTTATGEFDSTALDAELKRIAKLELPTLAQQMAADAGLPLRAVTISSARTMWGSCTADGRVRLNFRLLQLPPELMRHVVAHELAHLVEFNHSQRFWAIVAALDTDAKANKRALKNYSVLLEL